MIACNDMKMNSGAEGQEGADLQSAVYANGAQGFVQPGGRHQENRAIMIFPFTPADVQLKLVLPVSDGGHH